MRLFLLTAVAMLAFAANSLLTRAGVAAGLIGPMEFALWRVVAGTGVLGLLVVLRGGRLWPARVAGGAGLVVYLVGFSLAYAGLSAGIGALILFGVVQITMFGGAVLAREPVPVARWIGAGVAFAGLVVLLAPGGASVSLYHAGLMAAAGAGWGYYSLAARPKDAGGQGDPLGVTAANFVLAVPVVAMVWAVLPGGVGAAPMGIGLAVVSGAVTSGLGYALWYRLVPQLGAARAGVAQLTVPVLAALGGIALGEDVTLRFAIAAGLVLGGVGLASGYRGLTRR
ncbi:MAG: DMT family transporter [Pseudomonadota bacterium]